MSLVTSKSNGFFSFLNSGASKRSKSMSMSWEFIDLVRTGSKERNPNAQIKQEYQIKQSPFSKGQKKSKSLLRGIIQKSI